MKEITIEHAKFKEMKNKMIKVLANLEDIREGGKDIHITLQMMIDEITDAMNYSRRELLAQNRT